MFGFRVGKLSALGIVPDGQSPSLYKQPLASSPPLRQSLRLSFHACCTKPNSHFAGILGENMNKLTLHVCPSSDNLICPPAPAPPPPNPAVSKVNTPLNAGLTHFHCGWFCFQFSHHLSHPTTSEEKRKLLSRKQKKGANQTCKRHKTHFFPSCLVAKGQKCACRCGEATWGKTEPASPTSSVALKWLSLFSFLSFSLGERGSALRVLHRNHRAHNNRRKPVT